MMIVIYTYIMPIMVPLIMYSYFEV